MANIDYKSEISNIGVKAPTEDQKIAFLKNTMVPRKLDQFDAIEETDLDKIVRCHDEDRVNFYVNHQVNEFSGRSHKMSLKGIRDYVNEKLLTEDLQTDDNFDQEALHNGKLELKWSDSLQEDGLVAELDHLEDEIALVDTTSQKRDEDLDIKKADKFAIYGDGDVLVDDEAYPTGRKPMPKDKADEGFDGVHVEYDADMKTIKISHEGIVGGEGWLAGYTVGGVAKNRFFAPETPIKEVVRLILQGDPSFDNAIYFGGFNCIAIDNPDYDPADFHTTSKKLIFNDLTSVSMNDLVRELIYDSGNDLYEIIQKPGYTWRREMEVVSKLPMVVLPQAMFDCPNSPQAAEHPDRKLLKCNGVWLEKPYIDSEGTILSDEIIDHETADVIFTDDKGNQFTFRVFFIDEPVEDPLHSDHKFTFRFEEVN